MRLAYDLNLKAGNFVCFYTDKMKRCTDTHYSSICANHANLTHQVKASYSGAFLSAINVVIKLMLTNGMMQRNRMLTPLVHILFLTTLTIILSLKNI